MSVPTNLHFLVVRIFKNLSAWLNLNYFKNEWFFVTGKSSYGDFHSYFTSEQHALHNETKVLVRRLAEHGVLLESWILLTSVLFPRWK